MLGRYKVQFGPEDASEVFAYFFERSYATLEDAERAIERLCERSKRAIVAIEVPYTPDEFYIVEMQ